MINVETVVGLALAQQGDRYVGNAEADPANPNPSEWDCSELVQWACDRAGVTPAMPDGSWLQQRWCSSQGQIISVDQAIATRGALLFNHRDADGNPVDPGHGGRGVTEEGISRTIDIINPRGRRSGVLSFFVGRA